MIFLDSRFIPICLYLRDDFIYMTQLHVIFTHLLKRYREGRLTLLLTYNLQNILLLSLTNPVDDLKCDFKE